MRHSCRCPAALTVSPHGVAAEATREVRKNREQAFPGPLFLLGKTLYALPLDRIEGDIDRLERINALLAAGCRRYGPGFVEAMNEELGLPPDERMLRPLPIVVVRPSQDIAALCGAFARSRRFVARVPGILGWLLRHMADSEGATEGDLLSYLLFDGLRGCTGILPQLVSDRHAPSGPAQGAPPLVRCVRPPPCRW